MAPSQWAHQEGFTWIPRGTTEASPPARREARGPVREQLPPTLTAAVVVVTPVGMEAQDRMAPTVLGRLDSPVSSAWSMAPLTTERRSISGLAVDVETTRRAASVVVLSR